MYKILEITDDQVLETEQLGSKSKFWVTIGEDEDEQDWLFKIPRKNTGEHWAEKVAAEIARLLEIHHAQVELARFGEVNGSCSKSFINRGKRPELIHGNEILAGRVLGYKKEKRYGQSDHTYDNIKEAINKVGNESESQRALKQFAGYIVLDGLIGNTDRHHENWAFLKWSDEKKQTHHVIAPTFDHASSLGRELLDEKRELLMKENRVDNYIKKGLGAIYNSSDDRKGLNPFELVKYAHSNEPERYSPWLERVGCLDINQFETILEEIPEPFISETEKKFALKILEINQKKLTDLLK
ncbi:MAG: HipA domain-containing protein [Bacteroidota bacterium]